MQVVSALFEVRSAPLETHNRSVIVPEAVTVTETGILSPTDKVAGSAEELSVNEAGATPEPVNVAYAFPSIMSVPIAGPMETGRKAMLTVHDATDPTQVVFWISNGGPTVIDLKTNGLMLEIVTVLIVDAAPTATAPKSSSA